MNGEKFLDKLYKDLYLSNEVQHTKDNKDNKLEAIHKYMDRLENAYSKSDTVQKKEIIKSFFYKKYIITPNNIPKYLDEVEIIEAQKNSLGKWIDYLTDENAKYPMWAKYWAFQGMLKIGTYDEVNGVYMKRTSKTIAPFIECNPEILAKCIVNMQKYIEENKVELEQIKELLVSGNFNKMYTMLIDKNKKVINSSSNEGIWVKYNYKNEEDAKKLYDSLQGYNTGWCTASDYSYTKKQICGGGSYIGGDFYVYYTKLDNEYKVPRIAIRMDATDRIGEIRGIADSQNLEEGLEGILYSKLKTLKIDKRDLFAACEKAENQRKLTILNQKNGCNLTKEDVLFLFEDIETFGYESDPRIAKIIDRDILQIGRTIGTDVELMKLFLGKYGIEKFKYFPDDLRKDKSLFLEIFKIFPDILKYADESLKCDKEVVLVVVKQNVEAFQYASESLKCDRGFVLTIVEQDGKALEYADTSLKSDKEVVLVAVEQNGKALAYADTSLKRDKEVVLAAVTQDYMAFEYADVSLRCDRDFVLIIVERRARALKYADASLKYNRDFMLTVVKVNAMALQYANASFRRDKSFILQAMNEGALEIVDYIDACFKSDTDIINLYNKLKMEQQKNQTR